MGPTPVIASSIGSGGCLLQLGLRRELRKCNTLDKIIVFFLDIQRRPLILLLKEEKRKISEIIIIQFFNTLCSILVLQGILFCHGCCSEIFRWYFSDNLCQNRTLKSSVLM
jgi:hypothetical protein